MAEDNQEKIVTIMHNSGIFAMEKQMARIQNIIYLVDGRMFKLYINCNSVKDQSVFGIYTHNSINGWIPFVTDNLTSITDIRPSQTNEEIQSAFDIIIKYSEEVMLRCSRFLVNDTIITN